MNRRYGLLALGLALVAVLSTATSPVVASARDLASPELRALVQSAGRVRVIVQLRLPAGGHVPEGHLPGPAAVARQRSDIASVRSQLEARLQTTQHVVAHRYETVPLLALEVGPDALAQLEASPFHVETIVEDTLSVPTLAQSVPLVEGNQAWAAGSDGTGTMVAILDTGVDTTHGFFSGRVIEEACYSSNSLADKATTLCPNGQTQQTGPGAGVNCSISSCYHGTHVAGIAAGNGAGAGQLFSGVAKGAQIMSVQIFSRFDSKSFCGGAASTPCIASYDSDQIAGLERVYNLRAQHNFAAVNLSLGGGLSSTNCDGEPQKLMIDNLRSVGIATVIAAGNDGSTSSLTAPGCISSAVSVGSTTKSDVISSFSNMATFLSLLAPGESINSSLPGQTFGILSGTSMATPHVTGAFAVLKQAAPTASVTQILTALQSTGLPITDTRSGGSVTKPRIRIFQALQTLVPPPGGEIIIDNAPAGVQDAAGGRTFTGSWCTSAAANKYGADSLSNCFGAVAATYRWTPTIPSAGAYDVYVWWTTQPFQSTSTAITVVSADGSVTGTFDEQTGGGAWVLHGRYNFAAGTAGYVQVSNNANGHAAADAVRFVPVTGGPNPNPTPTLNTLSPGSATAGGPAFTLTVTGTNLLGTSVVRWNGADRTTTPVSTTQLQAAIPASDIAAAGSASVTVFNPAPGGGTSNTLTFTIDPPPSPLPTLNTLSPPNATAGGPAFTLTVTGTSFVTASVVRWNGADRTTTPVSTTQLQAAIPASDIAAAGSASVTVFNPAPGGGTSNMLTFTIDAPLPSTDIVIDNAAAGVQDATRTFTGSWCTSPPSNQFGADALNNCFGAAAATYRWTPTIPSAGAWDVYVWWSAQSFQSTAAPITVGSADGAVTKTFNETTGGGQWVLHGRYNFTTGTAGYAETTNNGSGHVSADAVRFVQATSTPNPVPALTMLSPSSAAAGGSAFTLTVTGTDFVTASVVRWENADRATTFVSATQLQAAILAGDIATAGSAQVTVFNPSPGGGTSNALTFTITQAQSTDPSVVGQWSAPFDLPLVSVHGALLHTGDVLMWDETGGNDTWLWRPSTGIFTRVPNPVDSFCGGQATLADGRLFIAGGGDTPAVAIPDAASFDPATSSWIQAPPMSYERWYPTATTLADGRVLVVSGAGRCLCQITTPEVYNPVTNTWSQLPNAAFTMPNYPFMFQLPDGRVLYAGSDEADTDTWALDVATQTWTRIDSQIFAGGSAAMYRPGFVIKSGSSSDAHEPFVPAVDTAFAIDMNQPVPAWQQVGSMAFRRAYHNLTMLPDGAVAVTGGLETTDSGDESQAVLPAEIWDPNTGAWSTMAAMQTPRSYHSIGLLLPDGRVLVGGSGRLPGITDQLNAEIFSPPYLFKGPRPTIASVQGAIAYNTNVFVETPDATSIASVSLVRPGAVTHAFDQNQRYVPLTFAPTTGGLTVQLPANANIAPPGYYMLFLVNTTGVPSVATFVRLPAASEPPPSTDIVIDNAAAGVQDATRTFTGSWCTSPPSNQLGADALNNCFGAAAATYRWTPTIPSAGAWDVYVWWSAQSFQSTAAPITVVSADGPVTKTFNETTGGGQWVLHGRYNFTTGTAGYAETTNNGSGHVSADAVRFVLAP